MYHRFLWWVHKFFLVLSFQIPAVLALCLLPLHWGTEMLRDRLIDIDVSWGMPGEANAPPIFFVPKYRCLDIESKNGK